MGKKITGYDEEKITGYDGEVIAKIVDYHDSTGEYLGTGFVEEKGCLELLLGVTIKNPDRGIETELYHIELYIQESGIHVFLNVLGPILDDPIECCRWVGRNFPRWLTFTTEHKEKAWKEREARIAEIEKHYQWALNVAYAEGG